MRRGGSQARPARRWKSCGLVVLIALIATACGASTEEQLAEQLKPVIKATSYGDDLIATCATEALLAEVGADGLSEGGVTPELLAADSSILQTYLEESETAPDVVAKCLDAKKNFGTAFSAATDSPDVADCVATNVDDDRAFDHAVAIVRGEDAEFDPDVDGDLALECLDDDHAAEFLGLPSSEDVAEPLATTLADSRRLETDEAECLATAVTDIGALRLDELEMTPKSVAKTFTSGDYDFTTAEVDAFEDGVLDCIDVKEQLSTQVFGSWPDLADCLNASLTDADLRGWAAAELSDAETLRFRAESTPKAIRECADDRDRQAFGELVSADDQTYAYNAGRGLFNWNADGPLATRTHDHEFRCMGWAMLSHFGRDRLNEIDRQIAAAETEADLVALYEDTSYFDFWVALMNGRSVCRSAEGLIQDVFEPSGFSEDSQRCILDKLTFDEVRSTFNDGHYFADVASIESVVSPADHFRAKDAREIAVDECATSAEKGRWNAEPGEESELSAVRSSSPDAPIGFGSAGLAATRS